jgi:hypothetical protein
MDRNRLAISVANLLVLVILAGPALARDKTDVVTLVNGDHVTGEIKKLEMGLVRLSTDSMATVYIEWKDITRITSEYFFEIEMTDGTRYFGSLAEPEAENTIRVELLESAVDLSKPDVVKIEPIRSTFWKRVDGSLKLGFSFTKSSEVKQLNAGFEMSHRARKFRNELSTSSIVTAKPDEPDSRRHDFSYYYYRYLKRRYSVVASSALQSNDELGLDLRVLLGGGISRNIVQTNSSLLVAGAGLAVNREWRSGEDPDDTSLELVLNADYSFVRYNTPKADIGVSLDVFPSVSDSGRWRAEFDTRFRREMINDFFLDIDLYFSYDNRETEEASSQDYGILLGVSWTF